MTRFKRAISIGVGLAMLIGVAGPISASNLAPDTQAHATPHQELMAFLMRGPAQPNLLEGKRIAMVVVNGADAVTFQLARDYLVEQGATVDVLTPRREAGTERHSIDAAESLLSMWDYAGKERPVEATGFLEQTDPRSYDVIYLPGNHPDTQSVEGDPLIAQYVAQASAGGKPIFAVGDSSLILARANLLRGRHATGARVLQPFLMWAGVDVYDEPVVRDSSIYTSRDAFDLPRLMAAMMEVLTKP